VQRRQFVLNSGICGQRMRMSGQPDMPAIIGINGRTHDPNRSTSRQNLERPKSGKSRRPCSWSVFSDSISRRQAACRSSGGLEGHRPGGGRGHPKQFLEIHWLALGLHFGGAVFVHSMSACADDGMPQRAVASSRPSGPVRMIGAL